MRNLLRGRALAGMAAAAVCCAGVTGAADPGDVFAGGGTPSAVQGAGSGGGWPPPWSQEEPADPWTEAEAEVVRLVNDKRPGYGCGKLSAHELLTQAAREHSQDQAGDSGFPGGGFFGGSSSARDRARGLGYAHPSGEIVANGFETAEEAVEAWTRRGHNQVLADCEAEHIGVGVVKGDGGPYWTVVLGHGA
ncbi:CAP domain-containing protein [Nocardiopsis dassonvillei]|uniref:CAP domain-containing protein n=1 Tax=Nocardiopsis dassonvillei TaxID=2014 RepID=UPI00363B4FFD